MMAPKVLAEHLEIRVNDLNDTFLPPGGDVARCCGGGARNISKQKSFVDPCESPTKA
jgi:hypothetical protein